MATAVAPPAVHNGLQKDHKDESCFPPSRDNINQYVRDAQYAVRGEIVARANELAQQLREGKDLPFDKIIMCNIGNPQPLGAKPMTYIRQLLALVDYPKLFEDPGTAEHFPADVIDRAKELLADFPGGTGGYTDSRGSKLCRQMVASGIHSRDGYPASVEDIWLTDGASPGVHNWMKMLLRNENDCILTPIPQYPLYSACLKLYGGTLLPYYLDEEKEWGLSIQDLTSQVEKARAEGKCVRALVVINPGNPTGNVLEYDNQREIVDFCKEYGIILMADEVYQTNIYNHKKMFTSFKKVLREAGPTYNDVVLVSFNSSSKGFFGECGRRGGYFELANGSEELHQEMYKLSSINLCSNTGGQITMATIMYPPKPGDPSYITWAQEMCSALESLKARAQLVVDNFNKLKGVSCNHTDGAMYAFPRFTFPEKFVKEAESVGRQPDFLYCLRLLEATGIVTVPGSGFKQVPGTYHIRTTILPQLDDLKNMTERISKFHDELWSKYG